MNQRTFYTREYACGHFAPGQEGKPVYYDYDCAYCIIEKRAKCAADRNEVKTAISRGLIIEKG